jgi:hypothetical protein
VEIGINNKIFFTTLYFFAVSVCHTIIIVTSSDRAININISSSSRSRGTHPVQIQQEQPPPPPQQNLSAFSLIVLCCLQSAQWACFQLGMLSLSRRLLLFSWASSRTELFLLLLSFSLLFACLPVPGHFYFYC